jgi:chlorobactene glucosyltransferase
VIFEYYRQIFPYTIIGFLSVSLAIAILNYFYIRSFDDFPTARIFPRVSILLPARNEEANIKECVESLLAQNYPDFEVIVLNDNSTDQTRTILEQLSSRELRLKIYDGESLPSGWLGKHWACHQLSQRASGELILFTDADTRHKTNSLSDSVSALIAQNADLVTAYPLEEMRTWGERFTVPILGFSIFCFFPLLLAEKLCLPVFSVTIGQFMLFRRSAFNAIGGYEAIRSQTVDDIKLGQNIITHGFRWQFMDATHHITCRMYNNFSEALDGFTKNIFAVFNHHILLYCIGWLWIAVSFLLPAFVLFNSFFMPTGFPTPIAIIAVIEAVVMVGLAYHRFRTPAYLVLVYPLSLLIFTWVAFRSLIYSLTGYGTWKGRDLAPPAFKL